MSDVYYLIACVGKKMGVAAPARDLYRSQWFKAARSYVESLSATWYILSAKFGLLAPEIMIPPYQRTLADMDAPARAEWARMVLFQIERQVPAGSRLVFLAGHYYRDRLIPLLQAIGYDTAVPLAGLGIGQQVAWLHKNTLRKGLL